MKPIIEDVKYRFRNGGILIKIIFINIGVWLILNVIGLLTMQGNLFDFSIRLLAMPTDWLLLIKPWTLITSMFTHLQVGHIFWNLLMFYFSARIFLEYNTERRLFQMYLIGGIVGAMFMWIIINFLPFFESAGQIAMGASAAVMAITISVCSYRPLLEVNLFGVVPVQLRYFGLAFFLIDLFQYYDVQGGHLAHIGGAIFGFWHGRKLAGAIDILKPIDKFFSGFTNLFKKKSNLYVSHSKVRQMDDYEYNYTKKTIQEKVDEILDKISRSGYDSLTKEEKDILHKSSRM